MYLLAHAMAGVLIGLILAAIVRDRRVVMLGALGGVLPDLIDKPLGHIILAETVGYGRLYFHGLTIVTLIAIAGLFIYYHRRSIGLLVLAAGMLSHQILDGMWLRPAGWLWPFLGPIPLLRTPDDFLWGALMRELSQPSEWLFFLLITGLFAYLYRGELKGALARLSGPTIRRLLVVILGLAILAALAVGGRNLL